MRNPAALTLRSFREHLLRWTGTWSFLAAFATGCHLLAGQLRWENAALHLWMTNPYLEIPAGAEVSAGKFLLEVCLEILVPVLFLVVLPALAVAMARQWARGETPGPVRGLGEVLRGGLDLFLRFVLHIMLSALAFLVLNALVQKAPMDLGRLPGVVGAFLILWCWLHVLATQPEDGSVFERAVGGVLGGYEAVFFPEVAGERCSSRVASAVLPLLVVVAASLSLTWLLIEAALPLLGPSSQGETSGWLLRDGASTATWFLVAGAGVTFASASLTLRDAIWRGRAALFVTPDPEDTPASIATPCEDSADRPLRRGG